MDEGGLKCEGGWSCRKMDECGQNKIRVNEVRWKWIKVDKRR